MERKKELKQEFKEVKVEGGIYVITNKQNGKRFVASTRNFKTLNGTRFTLETGTHTNRLLQEEWKELGKDAFEIDPVEVLKKPENQYMDEKERTRKAFDEMDGAATAIWRKRVSYEERSFRVDGGFFCFQ